MDEEKQQDGKASAAPGQNKSDNSEKKQPEENSKESRKETHNESRKESNRDSRKDSRRESNNDSRRDSNNDSRRESNSDSRRESNNDSRKESNSDSRRESNIDSRKESNSDSRRDSNNDSRRESNNDSRRESNNDSRRDSNNDSRRDSNNDSRRDSNNDSRRDSNKESHKDSNKESRKDSNKESHRESNKDSHKESSGKEASHEGQGFEVLPYDFDEQFKEKHKKPLYADARSLAVKIVTRCERTDSYLDKLIDTELKNDTLNDFDKALLNELTHGVIRWMRRLDWFLNGFYRGSYEKCQPEVRNAMRVALYQIMFLNKIPYSAAVNEAVEFVKRLHGDKHAGVVNGLLRTIIRTLENLVWPTRDVDEVNYLGMVQSHPNWMVKRWIQRLGFDDAEKFCEFNNKRPILGLRVNKLKSNIDEVETYLNNKGIATRRGANLDYFLTIKSMGRIYTDEYFKNGYFSVQDESAGLVSTLLDPKPGELIIDLCAAPGGKTMHMAELMNNEGRIVAIEKYESRAKALKNNLVRTNVTNTEVVHDSILSPETSLLKEELIGKADKILLDAPCSGLGVITKKPDIKMKRELEDIQKLQKLQIELINESAKYLKPGGVLVYSTCTTEPEENFEVITAFLEKNPDFKIDSAERFVKNKKIVTKEGYIETYPFKNFIDGSFSIRLVKNS